MILHWRIRTGSGSILSDQDWVRTKNFHSPFISVAHLKFVFLNWKHGSPARPAFHLVLSCTTETARASTFPARPVYAEPQIMFEPGPARIIT